MNHARDFLVFPLDVPGPEEAAGWVKRLHGHVGMFKVGLELFIRCGPDIVSRIKDLGGTRIFLDLKLHDIPATVGRSVAAIAELGVDFATIHCGDSPAMLHAAVAAAGGRLNLLGVTLLTSVSNMDLLGAGYAGPFAADPGLLVLKKSEMAKAAGLCGVVCSGRETRMIKKACGGGFLAVTPGVRPGGAAVSDDDQKRVVTPALAIAEGADFLVVGRPIRDADNPVETAEKILEEISEAISKKTATP